MTSFNADTIGSDVIKELKSKANGKTCIFSIPSLLISLLIAAGTVLITGTSYLGIGAETAINLARCSPKQLILLSRSEEKVAGVIKQILEIDNRIDVVFIEINLLDNSLVRKAAKEVKAVTNTIHGIINNAGIMAVRDYTPSKDGIESQFAVNHIGHFLLTNLLMDEILAAGTEATIVNLTSVLSLLAEVNLADPNFDVRLDLIDDKWLPQNVHHGR